MSGTSEQAQSDAQLEALLEYLHERRNFDFRGYKRASLSRRIRKRMQAVGVDSFERYTEVLEANPGEFSELFNTILINVTSLMRDPDAWAALESSVIPDIAARKGEEDVIRIWSAGCASGEEAYSLAVLFADSLGENRFRRTVKIYATDADEDALVAARHGRYKEADLVSAFGEDRTSRFFEPDGDSLVFRSDLRRALIFGRHDLVQDPPISRIDLMTCRNTLMYFTSDVQARILASFHFALNTGGFLFLGKSEALVTRTQLFQVVDLRQHILRKDGQAPDFSVLPAPASRATRNARLAGDGHFTEPAFEQAMMAQVLLDAAGTVVLANRAARRLLSIGSADLGRHLGEADFSFRPADLRGAVERVLRERQTATINDVAWHAAGPGKEPVTVDIVIAPVEGTGGVLITFLDVTRYQDLREELEHSRRQLETAYEELQSTVEELETTNEELQSTNEELETTNEELHSTNEELETMNEELQSTNEELEAINGELRERSTEVIELNQFLQSILGSPNSAVVVLGSAMQIRAWNRQAEELWGLRGDEVIGQHFLNLDIGFPVESLGNAIRASLAGRQARDQIVRSAVNRRGRPVECTVSLTSMPGEGNNRGVILMMDAAFQDGAAKAAQDGSSAPVATEDGRTAPAAAQDGSAASAGAKDGKKPPALSDGS